MSQSEPDAYVPAQGDLIWTHFDPAIGHEQGGRRPALVISDQVFNAATGLVIVCPITSRVRPFPTGVVLPTSRAWPGNLMNLKRA